MTRALLAVGAALLRKGARFGVWASRIPAFVEDFALGPGALGRLVLCLDAGAIMAFAPDLRAFASGRNFAAWLGLVPWQRSTGGKTRLGGVSKMGQADIRKLLIVGAMSRIRWIIRRGVLPDNWLGRVLGRKPRMVAAVALANKMARTIWAMMTREQNYQIA